VDGDTSFLSLVYWHLERNLGDHIGRQRSIVENYELDFCSLTYKIRYEPVSSASVTIRSSGHHYELPNHLGELSANSTGDSQARVGVSKETAGVLLNLADVETIGSILSVGQQASLEGTLLAANAAADTIADVNGVGESDSGRTRSTLGSLVDVCGSCGGRLVLATEAVDLNVVADQVQLAVDTDLEETRGAGETTSGSCAVDDLVGGGLDLVV
jgi:hypothetical protein